MIVSLVVLCMLVSGCAHPIRGVVAHRHIPQCVERNIALGCRPLYQPAEAPNSFLVYMACPDTATFEQQGCHPAFSP